MEQNMEFFHELVEPELYHTYNVKRGLRNADGSGVLVGLTKVGEVHGYVLDEGEKLPIYGSLRYRGIDVEEIVRACRREKRFGFEEVAYLLLFGRLPSQDTLTVQQLSWFNKGAAPQLYGRHDTKGPQPGYYEQAGPQRFGPVFL